MDSFHNSGLRIAGLSAGYGRISVLHSIGMHAPAGSVTLALGPNGSGKTTLLHSIFGLADVFAGRIYADQSEVTGLSRVDIARAGLTLIPQGRRLFSRLTVRENLMIALWDQRKYLGRTDIHERLAGAWDMFPVLGSKVDALAGSLSGGQQQMLCIARGLMRKPRVLALDEPSSGLAPLVVVDILRRLRTLSREWNMCVLLVEQSTLALRLSIADNIYVLSAGRVVRSAVEGDIRLSDIESAYFARE